MRRFFLFGIVLCFGLALTAQPLPRGMNPFTENQQVGDSSLEFLPSSLIGDPIAGKTVLFVGANGQIACRLPRADEAVHIDRRSVILNEISPSQMRTTQSAGLTIQLRSTAQLDANPAAKALFVRAAQTWESIIATPVTIIIDVDYGTTRFGEAWPDPNPLGSASSQYLGSGTFYPQIRTALVGKASNSAEQSLYDTLPFGSVPTDLGSSTAISTPSSTLRAIGQISAVANPATEEANFGPPPSIGFNSNFPFDLNPDNGITSGQYDFLSVAIHEIGHVLGFSSNMGRREFDTTSPLYLSIHDLFRFRPGVTNGSFGVSQRVLTTGGSQVFFGGGAALVLSTGNPKGENGDLRQGSHWKDDNLGGTYIGIMDPTIPPGVSQQITEADRHAFDRIGWQVASAATCDDQSWSTTCNTTKTGTLDSNDCPTDEGSSYYEWWGVSLTAGQTVTVQITSANFTPFFYVRGPSPNFTQLAFSSNGAARTITASETGTHWIQASSSGVRVPGTFTLSVQCSGTTPVCQATTSKFCTQSKRFEVSISAKDPRTGKTDTGHVMSSTDSFGYFAFPVLAGNTTDPQVFVKVLDGRVINGKFWVFYASLTDNEFTLTIKDAQTGKVKTYKQNPYTQEARNDTEAF